MGLKVCCPPSRSSPDEPDSETSWLILQTIDDESTPPLRQLPKGTSDLNRKRTASLKSRPYLSTASSRGLPAMLSAAGRERCQYESRWWSRLLTICDVPGGRLFTPVKKVSPA